MGALRELDSYPEYLLPLEDDLFVSCFFKNCFLSAMILWGVFVFFFFTLLHKFLLQTAFQQKNLSFKMLYFGQIWPVQ